MAKFSPPFIVMVYAPMIGRANGPRRVRVEARRYSLASALEVAVEARRRYRSAAWVIRAGTKAHQ